ncbi:MAG: tryptophan 7-halogenase [Akkermansiaceae bacterium]
MISNVIVLGSGSAGLIAALGLKKRNPDLEVTVVSSSLIGTIGVGEGTVPYVVDFIHNYLKLDEAETYQSLDPVYKLGVELQWGKNNSYFYPFTDDFLVKSLKNLPRGSGSYHQAGDSAADLLVSLMQHRTLPIRATNLPNIPPPGKLVAWHIENHRLIETLVTAGKKANIHFVEDKLESAESDTEGNVTSVLGESGNRYSADLWIDASGFRAELISKHCDVPFTSFAESLYCDRAIVGGWQRESNEEILNFTVSETMNAGWAWRIDHPDRINRGYVYSSAHLSADDAAVEFQKKNPQVKEVREVKFTSGQRETAWAHNVVAIGNASGFVEPLEATAIMCACLQTQWLADGLYDAQCTITPSMRNLYNKVTTGLWAEIRDFLAIHYKYNDRLETPFWQQCQNEIPSDNWCELLDFYTENGPSNIADACLPPLSPFGIAGYLAHFVGLGLPAKTYQAPRHERRIYQEHCQRLDQIAKQGLPMKKIRELLLQREVWQKMRSR